MGIGQQHRNAVDSYLKSPHTWFTSSSCKKLFAFLLAQKSLGTRVIPKQKQFKQPIWEEDEEGRREGRKETYFIFCTGDRFYITRDYAIYHGRDCEAWVHRERALSLVLLQCLLSDVWGGKVTATDFTAPLSGLSTPTPGYPELWGREVKCFHMRCVFILVAYEEESH